MEQAPQLTEGTATSTPETQAATDKQISPQYAALARQQRAIRKQQQELQAERERLKQEAEAYKKDYVPVSKLKEDPLSVLIEQGLTHEQIMELALSQQDPNSQLARQFDSKIRSVEEKLSAYEKQQQEKQEREYQQAVDRVRNEVTDIVDASTEYELIKANEAQEAVVSLIEETFKESGKLLTAADAAKQVEDYLLEQAEKLAKLEKVKARLNPAPETATQQAPAAKAQPQKTLTHALTATPSKPLTAKERRERAIAAFRGGLA